MKITNNPNEEQRVNLDIVFKVRHEPFNESHIKALITNYFSSKGVNFDGEEILI